MSISDNYHDFLHNKGAVCRRHVAGMNKALFASLKHGGIYLIVDHRAAKGMGAAATLKSPAPHGRRHRQAGNRSSAGFKLAAESKRLTRPQDDDSKRVFEDGEHDHTDQMVLKFRKP